MMNVLSLSNGISAFLPEHIESFFMLDENTMLGQGDCLELMKSIPDGSVDMILTDPPYGTTACKWDSVIPFEPMWSELKRIIKPNGAIVLFGSQPFTSKLVNSNIENFSHQWIWDKGSSSSPLLANKMPLKTFEDILVFYFNYNEFDIRRKYFKKIVDEFGIKKSDFIKQHGGRFDHCFRTESLQFNIPTEMNYKYLVELLNLDKLDWFMDYDLLYFPRLYNPQKIVIGRPKKKGLKGINKKGSVLEGVEQDNISFNNEYHPNSFLRFNNDKRNMIHPTQKPVALLEYLIRTYTNESETVLDFTMGSGSTGVAAKNLNRSFIGIELDEKYFQIAKERITSA